MIEALKEKKNQTGAAAFPRRRTGTKSRLQQSRRIALQHHPQTCKKRSKRQNQELNKKPNRLLQEEVDENLIAHIVSKWTGIPVSKMLEGEAERLLHLGKGTWKNGLSAKI